MAKIDEGLDVGDWAIQSKNLQLSSSKTPFQKKNQNNKEFARPPLYESVIGRDEDINLGVVTAVVIEARALQLLRRKAV